MTPDDPRSRIRANSGANKSIGSGQTGDRGIETPSSRLKMTFSRGQTQIDNVPTIDLPVRIRWDSIYE